MTNRRQALDNDMLADLGIHTPAAPTPPTPTPQASTTQPAPTPATATAPEQAPAPTTRTKRIGVDVSEDVWIAVKVHAAQQGTTVADLIRSHLHSMIAS